MNYLIRIKKMRFGSVKIKTEMNKRILRQCLGVMLFLGILIPCIGQDTNFIIPRTNSKAIISQTIASTQIEITYNRPNKKNRQVFGDLVPYDKLWRTGSDEATKIYFSTPVSLAGNKIDSGRYELFTIPGKDKWEVILQKASNQWGSYGYDDKNDVMRFPITPVISDKEIETFTMSVDEIGSDHGTLNIAWDRVIVPIDITIDLRETVVPKLEKALLKDGRRPYFNAAMFYYENDLDINRAAELMALALEQNPGHIGMLYRQALILRKKGDIDEAIMSAEKSYEGAQSAGPELKAEYTKLNKALLEDLKAMKH